MKMNLQQPLPSTCYLNTSESGTLIKSNMNSFGLKLQKRKQRLHLGAKKVDPTFFPVLEKENEKKTFINAESDRSAGNNVTTHTKSVSTEDSEEESCTDELDLCSKLQATSNNEQPTKNSDSFLIENDCPAKLKKEHAVNNTSAEVEESAEPKFSNRGTDEALKKFLSAKSISSERYFNEIDGPVEYKADLSRFTNCSSISSDELFDRGSAGTNSGFFLTSVDNIRYEELAACLKNGVTKVAGKLGSALSSFASRLPHEFGEF